MSQCAELIAVKGEVISIESYPVFLLLPKATGTKKSETLLSYTSLFWSSPAIKSIIKIYYFSYDLLGGSVY